MKAVLGRLARAINDGLEGSSDIAESVRKLETLGYRFTLYLDATILLTREDGGETRTGPRSTARRVRTGSLKLSDKDLKFLKSLKISLTEKSK